ncbi:MAG TPA: sodium:proton antiporter [Xanthobacteraceae bacterium]|jgi:CPA1 family monovalent cation:H+ antiporter|nr:sodium:proton antiporter [Xanthobacteraceae bacterium]
MELEPVDLFAIVLALAVIIGCVNYLWVRLPPAIGMLLGSLLVSFLFVGSDRLFHLHAMHWLRDTLDDADLPHLFLDGTVALLLFAGSLHVDIAELNRRRRLILLLATASVMISTFIFSHGIYLAFNLLGISVPLAWCLVLGAVLAPTDAVVVENLLARSGLPSHLRAAIVGESLFNDGAGVVLFLLALGVTQGDVIHYGHGRILAALVREIAGGAVLGVIFGWAASFLIRKVKDEGLQLLISLTLVLGCYRVASLTMLSGPIAVVTAGLCLSSPSSRFAMPPDTRAVLIGFWSPLNQVLNIVLFLLMGLQILGLIIRPIDLLPVLFAIPLAVISRFLSVAVPLALTRESILEKCRAATVLTWAGLRGGISIALALTLPQSPWRTDLLVVTYAVVIFTIVVQGLTFGRGLRIAYAPEPEPAE